DHIIPKAHGGTDDPSNLELLCWPHHRKKTAIERIR
ncbi:HNH endonuclease, partial [Yersinia ruckeri]